MQNRNTLERAMGGEVKSPPGILHFEPFSMEAIIDTRSPADIPWDEAMADRLRQLKEKQNGRG